MPGVPGAGVRNAPCGRGGPDGSNFVNANRSMRARTTHSTNPNVHVGAVAGGGWWSLGPEIRESNCRTSPPGASFLRLLGLRYGVPARRKVSPSPRGFS